MNKELEIIRKYIAANPYPTYEKIISEMNEHPDYIKKLMDGNIYLLLDYTKDRHKLCKQIYERITNREIVRKCGEELHKTTNFHGMQACYYTISNFSPLRNSQNCAIRGATKLIDYYWDGLGNWRC